MTMQMKHFKTWAAAGLLALGSASAQGAVFGLFDYGFNVDGVASFPLDGDPVPGAVDLSGLDLGGTDLGIVTATITGAGDHFFGGLFDYEIDEAINGFDNELGATSGVAAAGQSWEIDVPGASAANGSEDIPYVGDIYFNLEDSDETISFLDNEIAYDFIDDQFLVDNNGDLIAEDMAMAMGFSFTLAAGETATITLSLADVAPAGFYLEQHDPDSDASVFLSGDLRITGGGTGNNPEPSILFLMGAGLMGLVYSRRRFKV